MRFFSWLALAAVAIARNVAIPYQDIALDGRQTATTFKWTSTDILIYPKNDTRAIAGVKDPSIIQINDTYHVFGSTANIDGYGLFYTNFTDFSKANAAPFFYLDQSGIGSGYRAAPEVFWFEPHKLWYLIFQNGNAAYSTNKDISNPKGWSAPTNFYNGTPALIDQNLSGGYWVDMWVICDAKNCHLFSSDDNGQLYRSQTTIGQFPTGMSEPVIVLQEANKFDLYEAANVYYIGNSTYLLIVECLATSGTLSGQRYFRSWTSSDIAGPWKALADTTSNPFAGETNVVWTGNKWTRSVSHGEAIRTNVDQTLSLDLATVRYLYQGVDPASDVTYNALPWRLGLLTRVQ